MKRPTFALLSLLALLALGLVAAGPKHAAAGSLGELAFAMQIEQTCAGDPIVCPLVCCPLAEEMERCDEALKADAAMELNAPQTSELADLSADDDQDEAAYDQYGSEYANAVEAGSEEAEAETGNVAAADASEEMELNAADTALSATGESDDFEDYYGDYIYDATDFGDDYYPAEADAVPAPDAEESCNDVVNTPKALPCESVAGSQISEADLLVKTAEGEAAANACTGDACTAESCPMDEPETAHPYDEYGRQVGDSYADESYADDDYSEGYYSDEYYDDEYYYEYGYDEEVPAAETSDAEADRSDASDDGEVATADESSDLEDAYYEDYFYEDYYSDDFDSDQYGEDDYERYYSEEYYEQLDEAEEKAASANDDDVVEDYASEYDAMYDEVVYGDDDLALEDAESIRDDLPCPPVVTADMLEVEENLEATPEIAAIEPAAQAYLAGCCIDEANADLVDDLPWADEVEVAAESHADVAEIDVPATGEVSEYGSDYAEDFYRTLEDELKPLDEKTEAAAPAALHAENLPIAAAKTMHSKFDVGRWATYCGSTFAAWSEKIADFGDAIRTACGDVNLDTQTR